MENALRGAVLVLLHDAWEQGRQVLGQAEAEQKYGPLINELRRVELQVRIVRAIKGAENECGDDEPWEDCVVGRVLKELYAEGILK